MPGYLEWSFSGAISDRRVLKGRRLAPSPSVPIGELPDLRRLSCLLRCWDSTLPRKGSEVPVVLSTVVVPIDPKNVQMATRRLSQSESRVGRMERVVEVHRLPRVFGSTDALPNLREHATERD